jgi:hypothetical protein
LKCEYKGFDIEVKREKCLAGYPLTYYSIFKISEGWELDYGYYDTEGTTKGIIKKIMEDMKLTVDDYILNPQDYDY